MSELNPEELLARFTPETRLDRDSVLFAAGKALGEERVLRSRRLWRAGAVTLLFTQALTLALWPSAVPALPTPTQPVPKEVVPIVPASEPVSPRREPEHLERGNDMLTLTRHVLDTGELPPPPTTLATVRSGPIWTAGSLRTAELDSFFSH